MTIEQLNQIDADIASYKKQIQYLKTFRQKITETGGNVPIMLGGSFNDKHHTNIPSYHASYLLSKDIEIYKEKLELAESQLISAAVSYSESLKG